MNNFRLNEIEIQLFFLPLRKKISFSSWCFYICRHDRHKRSDIFLSAFIRLFFFSLSIHLLFWMNVVLWNRFQVLFFFLNGKEFLHSWYTFEIRTIHQSEKILLYLRKVNDVFTGAAAAKKSIWGKSLNTQK